MNKNFDRCPQRCSIELSNNRILSYRAWIRVENIKNPNFMNDFKIIIHIARVFRVTAGHSCQTQWK